MVCYRKHQARETAAGKRVGGAGLHTRAAEGRTESPDVGCGPRAGGLAGDSVIRTQKVFPGHPLGQGENGHTESGDRHPVKCSGSERRELSTTG